MILLWNFLRVHHWENICTMHPFIMRPLGATIHRHGALTCRHKAPIQPLHNVHHHPMLSLYEPFFDIYYMFTSGWNLSPNGAIKAAPNILGAVVDRPGEK